MFSSDRNQLRKFFFEVWNKLKNNEPLQPLEKQIAEIIEEHPEYHPIFENPEKYQDKDYFPELGETNPFLHLSLHLSVREQLSTNRPAGILDIYRALLEKHASNHDVEHMMLECLAETIWEAQRNQQMPDEAKLLEKLKALLNH